MIEQSMPRPAPPGRQVAAASGRESLCQGRLRRDPMTKRVATPQRCALPKAEGPRRGGAGPSAVTDQAVRHRVPPRQGRGGGVRCRRVVRSSRLVGPRLKSSVKMAAVKNMSGRPRALAPRALSLPPRPSSVVARCSARHTARNAGQSSTLPPLPALIAVCVLQVSRGR